MRRSSDSFSAIETCIHAVQIWMAFFLITSLIQIISPEQKLQQCVIISTGAIALAIILYRWIRQADARHHAANLALLTAGVLIGIDMAAALTDS